MDNSEINEIKSSLYYCETSPSGLRWKQNRYSFNGRKIQVYKDSVAGYLKKTGYWSVHCGKQYQCHRLVMILHDVDIHGKEVDHVDRNRQNNKFSNLRVVDRLENMQNKTKYSNNTSGTTGVFYSRNRENEYWVVSWVDEYGKAKKKHFSIKKFDNARELAENFRKEILKKLNSNGMTYTNTHGG